MSIREPEVSSGWRPDDARRSGGTLDAMSFRPQSVRGAPAAGLPGSIDYRLARNAVIREFRKGRLSRVDVCDAHPELVRAARALGAPTDDDCPICEEVELVHVTYVFGERLPAHGRCIADLPELARLARSGSGELACYVVEVCPSCSWNHLARTFVVQRRRRA